MTTPEISHYAWHPSYGVEDERAAQADYERRAKAQAAIEWLIDNDPAVTRVNNSVSANGITPWLDLFAAMEAAYLAGLEDKESTR